MDSQYCVLWASSSHTQDYASHQNGKYIYRRQKSHHTQYIHIILLYRERERERETSALNPFSLCSQQSRLSS